MNAKEEIRNLAIVAHVDHGKTTLVDGMFAYAGTFRANKDMGERILDSDDQERERGITILAKNTAIEYKGKRINIVDTPGHADFGGQVERTLTMADAVLLLVDSFEGPMPQTRFVLRKAFERGLTVLVMINKIDRPDARPIEVLDEVFDLFCDLGATDEQLDFPVIYGSGRDQYASLEADARDGDLEPMMDFILEKVPVIDRDIDAPVQFQASTLDHDDFLGRIGVGRVSRGTLWKGKRYSLCHPERGVTPTGVIKKLFRYEGLTKVAVDEVTAGDIAVVSGIDDLCIGDTLCPVDEHDPLPGIMVDEPTVSMVFQVNDSPFAGLDGKYVTSRHIRSRLEKAALRDVALSLADTDSSEAIEVKGRGVMHIGVLIERMRREGYEFAVGKPNVITKEIDGVMCEPYERASVEVPSDFAGKIIDYLSRRRGEMLSMEPFGVTASKIEFSIPARGLIGARTPLLTLSTGEMVLSHVFECWKQDGGLIPRRQTGVLIADRGGPAVAYGLAGLTDRGIFFVAPGMEVYEGMVVGVNNKEQDLPVNVCRAKKLTNMRASGRDDNVNLPPATIMSLEEALEYVEHDELLEITPKFLRIRKRVRNANDRKRTERQSSSKSQS
jgi:GTP-binding protein